MAQVLVLDDEPSIGRLIDAILSGAGYEVRSFTRAKDALEALESFEPDAIISDINMPGMDGLEFCRVVREKERFHFTPFIFLSALSERRDMREGIGFCGGGQTCFQGVCSRFCCSKQDCGMGSCNLALVNFPDLGVCVDAN